MSRRHHRTAGVGGLVQQGPADHLRVEQIAGGLWAIAMYDPAWRSWIVCYLLRRGASVVLIDAGKVEQSNLLAAALKSLSISPPDVTDLVFSHGHGDHVGGSSAFPAARHHLHALDASLAAERGMAQLDTDNRPAAQTGTIALGQITLEYRLVGVHTSGSWVLWDEQTRALFSGDFLCWFNERLPADDLVAAELTMRRHRLVRFVDWWTTSPRFGDAAAFRAAARELASCFAPALLCTGHGPVFRGEIGSFLEQIAAAGGGAADYRRG